MNSQKAYRIFGCMGKGGLLAVSSSVTFGAFGAGSPMKQQGNDHLGLRHAW